MIKNTGRIIQNMELEPEAMPAQKPKAFGEGKPRCPYCNRGEVYVYEFTDRFGWAKRIDFARIAHAEDAFIELRRQVIGSCEWQYTSVTCKCNGQPPTKDGMHTTKLADIFWVIDNITKASEEKAV